MGLMAESMVAYAQPLLDETDGSHEQMQNAMSIAQMCWNLALLNEPEQEEMLASMRPYWNSPLPLLFTRPELKRAPPLEVKGLQPGQSSRAGSSSCASRIKSPFSTRTLAVSVT